MFELASMKRSSEKGQTRWRTRALVAAALFLASTDVLGCSLVCGADERPCPASNEQDCMGCCRRMRANPHFRNGERWCSPWMM